MKFIPGLSAIAALTLVACDTMSTPISSGSFDPLSAPGSDRSNVNVVSGPSFSAGEFVRATIDNTAFFKARPKGDADADKLLPRGTSMKVISTSGSYVKVELDSGDIGFVPSVMLENPNATPAAPIPGTNEYQVYPPLPGGSGAGMPLPPVDPAGLPPEGAIPTVIDPDAPSPNTPVPPVTPSTETFPTPPETKVPLPPNGESAPPSKVEKE
ncbi:MAG: hypothetical protein ABIS50_24970 [Luteolibacter sp.]|uniref:hypothetical protein n=1 Tax=Luteolibacter sp. TaxID=1962973 RepID=UPI003262E83C